MNKGFGRGFFAGLAAAGLILCLGMTALAAGRTISVDDGIQITFNGAAFTPKDASGRPVELFTYNGTTYAPLRAICEAAGLSVSYDAATRTAQVSDPSASSAPQPPASPAPGGFVTQERAQEIALAHAGVKAADAVFIQTHLDYDHGRARYEVEFHAGTTEYDYEIDAQTGEVISFDYDVEGYQPSAAGASGQITPQRAQEIALAQAPAGSTVVKCKLDYDDGRAVYELELRSGAVEYECKLDAASGAVLSWEMDD